MKVLFAVNSESISDAIIKKYQKDYREILSYKNVYYFNAIQKEIQQDKSYDRIVISEDLEPFSNNNYESIDKFIFEKLDGISDEAHDSQGNENSIILICSDRHTKGSSFLVKLFSLGIYNALLGNDRSMEEVCRLINKPRTKKEAKIYYQINTGDVNYKAESENEVSESEIQNIISHFKKLGKNPQKYASSFEKIASQYTNEQLKIIINCLPIKVKAILEESSTKYQEIMSVNGKMVKGIKSTNATTKEAEKRTGLKIDIIENKMKETKMTRPIVIPNSVKSSTEKKVVSVQPKKKVAEVNKKVVVPQKTSQVQAKKTKKPEGLQEPVEENRTNSLEKRVKTNVVKERPIKRQELVLEKNEIDSTQLDQIENIQPVKKGRGRPRKNPVEVAPKPKGKRGRPSKKVVENPILDEEEQDLDVLLGDLDSQSELNLPKNKDVLQNVDDKDEENLDFALSEEIELPELDELDDIDDFDNDEETPLEITEESYDEFNDYDEYGEYETQTQIKSDKINNLNEEDILSDEDVQLPGFDDLEDDDNDVFELSEGFDEEDDEESEGELLPGLDNDEDDDLLVSGLDDDDDLLLSGIDDEEDGGVLPYQEEEEISSDSNFEEQAYQNTNNFEYNGNTLKSIEPTIDYSMSNLNSLMTKDKKIVTFLGSPKNGVSFLVNNLAELFASLGINTAILDMTKNKNSYYIYTQNEESLRKIAYTSLKKLQDGIAEGIRVKQNLTVYTALPNDGNDYSNAEPILSTLVQSHSLILIDCDFDTNPSYFASAQEIYLVQSMDILTIQPLTAFLRELNTKGVLEPEKVKVVINKELKVRGLTNKAIIGGMSFYNDPAMSFMTELFNKDTVKYCSIPFEEVVYSKYLEAMLNCNVSIKGYSKNFMNKLKILGDMVYPLTSRQTYSPKQTQSYAKTNFSNSMNDTLNKMKKKY